MHRGTVGAGILNAEQQKALNPGEDGVIWGNRNFRIKDKVMQVKNNYDKEAFNGDTFFSSLTHKRNFSIVSS